MSELLINAAEDLEGVQLLDGWTIEEKIQPKPGATGGVFSVCYWARSEDGKRAFCKVLNYQMAFFSSDPPRQLQAMTEAYNFERDLLFLCERKHMSRVVLSIGNGQFNRDGYALPTVNYILFEVANADIRAALDEGGALDSAFKLRCLHHVATGIRQLHQNQVAHQDLKPSNVLVFPEQRDGASLSKVGDLGRASMLGRTLSHDGLTIAGDKNYAPPEQLYGEVYPDFARRRYACDLYQLGSMISFVFTAATMNAWLTLELHPEHSWVNWGGSYDAVLPYVRDAFGRAVARMEPEVPEEVREKVMTLVRQLCDPDPNLRGHSRNRQQVSGNPYGLDRVVTELDLLARRAEIQLRKSIA